MREESKYIRIEYHKELFQLLMERPLSRRMAATELGFKDQTYMVTPHIVRWIRQGKAKVIGMIKCTRSGRLVEAITTNPDLFPKETKNQLEIKF
jgi:hypothetical protein